MRSLKLFGTLALATSSAFAQIFQIAAPTSGQTLTIGYPFTVEVDQPVSLGIMESVSVVIGLQLCGTSRCPADDGDNIFGQILYAGDYSPERHEVFKPPYQNFTFTIPAGTQPGKATIHVADLFLVGAGPSPTLASRNVSVKLSHAPASAKFKRSDVRL